MVATELFPANEVVIKPEFFIYKQYTYQQMKLTASISKDKGEAGI